MKQKMTAKEIARTVSQTDKYVVLNEGIFNWNLTNEMAIDYFSKKISPNKSFDVVSIENHFLVFHI
jgi:hypothetical protein